MSSWLAIVSLIVSACGSLPLTDEPRGDSGPDAMDRLSAMDAESTAAQVDAPSGTADSIPDAPISASVDATVDASLFDRRQDASQTGGAMFTTLATVPSTSLASWSTVTLFGGHHLLVNGTANIGSYGEGYVLSVDGLTGQATEARSYVGGLSDELYNQFAMSPVVIPLSDTMILFSGGDYRSMATWYAVPIVTRLDPGTLEATAMPDMLSARVGHTGTVLLDGTILFTGGASSTFGVVATAEVYDPASGQTSMVDPMTSARDLHQAVRLAEGKVLIVGGYAKAQSNPYDPTALVTFGELYDPVAMKFTMTGAMGQGRVDHTATLLQDGRVVIVGGTLPAAAHPSDVNASTAFANATLFDPDSGWFSDVGALATGRYRHSATLLPDGRVLILGGIDAAGATLASAELYDPKAETFTTIGTMSYPRYRHSAYLMDDGRVIIAGGDASGVIEIFDPATLP